MEVIKLVRLGRKTASSFARCTEFWTVGNAHNTAGRASPARGKGNKKKPKKKISGGEEYKNQIKKSQSQKQKCRRCKKHPGKDGMVRQWGNEKTEI